MKNYRLTHFVLLEISHLSVCAIWWYQPDYANYVSSGCRDIPYPQNVVKAAYKMESQSNLSLKHHF